MKKIFIYILFVAIIHHADACVFQFVPYGADWGHSYLLSTLPFLQDGQNIGIITYQRSFLRNFTLDPPLPNMPSTITIRENSSTLSKFSRLYSSHKVKFDVSISTTDIRFEGISDDAIEPLHSWTKNEVNFSGTVLLFEKFKNKYNSSLFLDLGMQTALISTHGIDNTIGWMKLEMDKINPRLMPGNYSNNLSLGLSSLLDFKRFQIYSTGNFCNYLQVRNGYIYGREVNLSSTICYNAFVKNSKKIHLYEGLYFEHGFQDEFYESGKSLISVPCGSAQGNALFLSSGICIQYGQISCFAKYYQPLWQYNFSEHQLFNQAILLTGASFSF